jgi:glycosyltransferase involved in cell wall biosynthesis
MKISVVIPLFNSGELIEMTLGSVFHQTVPPYEILLLDDGSSDDTIARLEQYKQRIKVFSQGNQGVAAARNKLCEIATGDFVAFLDHDDIWHPRYLENLHQLINNYPDCVAYFAGHVNFYGYNDYKWNDDCLKKDSCVELFDPLTFLKIVNRKSGIFGSVSFLCIPKKVLNKYGKEPFCAAISGVDDAYLYRILPLFGSAAYDHMQLVAYRIIKEAQSTDKLKACEKMVTAFEILSKEYQDVRNKQLKKEIEQSHASERRQYAKRLMGDNRISEAKYQLKLSLQNSSDTKSRIKSIGLIFLMAMPRIMHPKWPARYRE